MQDSKTEKQVIKEIAERIVDREIYTNCSYLISELATNEKYSDELMQVCVNYTDNSEEIDEINERIDELETKKDDAVDGLNEYTDNLDMNIVEDFYDECIGAIDDLFNNAIEELESDKQDLENEQEYPNEALEHWIVSSWLAGKLEEHGQMVMDFNDLMIWGRTTSGQAIVMDYIIQCIAEELHNKVH